MMREPFLPVLIIGAARSGTKLLRDLIARHPEVDCVPYDINYIWCLGNEGIGHDEFSPDLISPAIASRIRGAISEYHQKGSILVEKTISNCLRVPFVNEVFPRAKFIHLVRDGRDVVESSHRQWLARPDFRYIMKKALSFPLKDAFGHAAAYAVGTVKKIIHPQGTPRSIWGARYKGIERDLATKSILEICAIQWARCVEAAAFNLTKMSPDRVITIHYESLVRNPATELYQVAEFLDVDRAPYERAAHTLPISESHVGKGLRRLDEAQLRTIMPYIEKGLRLTGYE